MEKIIIGQIVKTIGLKGLLKVNPITKDVNRYKSLKTIYIDDVEYSLEISKPSGSFANIKICGIDTVEEAEKLKNKYISVDRQNAIKLNKGEYFIQDLIGCKVEYYDGKILGEIVDVDNFGASDILYISDKKNEFAIAFVEGIFESVDIQNKHIKVSKKFDEVYLVCE